MPDLQTSLREYDLGMLRILAEKWGLELHVPDKEQALAQLVALMLEPDLLEEIVETLPSPAQDALHALLANQGTLKLSDFTRLYGEIRIMGPGRRDRERPDRQPASPAEILWYRGLVAQNIRLTDEGAIPFVYIPQEFQDRLPRPPIETNNFFGRPATPAEHKFTQPATDLILDDLCTLLAWLRNHQQEPGFTDHLQEDEFTWALQLRQLDALLALARAVGVATPEYHVDLDKAKTFLEASRGAALLALVNGWRQSEEVNELGLVPGLRLEGEWEITPRRTRERILDFLSGAPEGRWWSLPAFVADIKNRFPDFQRPAGDFDTWYIRDRHSGEYLQGFDAWDAVDGALLIYLITCILHSLGLVDLARSSESGPVSSFRKTANWERLLNGLVPMGFAEEKEQFRLRSDARMHAPRLAPRQARYQLARFTEWESAGLDGYRYRITPASLGRARRQGLEVSHLLSLLRKYAATVPPHLPQALERWEKRGVEVFLEQAVVLRVSSPDILQALRASRAARFLGDPLGPAAVIVRPQAVEKVLGVLAEMGYLGEAKISGTDQGF
jgi:hypothetical protein